MYLFDVGARGGDMKQYPQYSASMPSEQMQYSPSDDEIDLAELFKTLWAAKKIIIAITMLFAVATSIVVWNVPNQYKSSVILAPAQKDGGGGLGGLAAQYGGLAAMAGINIGKDSGKLEQAVELVKSWSFLDSFVSKYQLKPEVMAVEGWDKESNKLSYDLELFNPETKMWAADSKGVSLEPTSWKTFKVFSTMVAVTLEAKTSLLTITVEYYSPEQAKNWSVLLAKELNQHFQAKDVKEARSNIDYLKKKTAETSIAEMQSVFYGMIEGQTKTLMLAEVSEEYLIKTVVPAMLAEEKSKPKRSLIVLASGVFGLLFSIVFVLVRKTKASSGVLSEP